MSLIHQMVAWCLIRMAFFRPIHPTGFLLPILAIPVISSRFNLILRNNFSLYNSTFIVFFSSGKWTANKVMILNRHQFYSLSLNQALSFHWHLSGSTPIFTIDSIRILLVISINFTHFSTLLIFCCSRFPVLLVWVFVDESRAVGSTCVNTRPWFWCMGFSRILFPALEVQNLECLFTTWLAWR